MVSDKKKAYMKQWALDNTKKTQISKWRHRGLKDDNDMVYNRYINSTNCENPKCNVVYGNYGDGTGTCKCMDHDHTPGLENNFRNILCHRCNVNLNMNNTSGTPNIYWDKKEKRWKYQRTLLGKGHKKSFNSYYETIIYKWLYEDGYTLE
jgi:hypothetical protein